MGEAAQNSPPGGGLTPEETLKLDALSEELMALANTRAIEIFGDGDRALTGRETALFTAYVETIAAAYRGSDLASGLPRLFGRVLTSELEARLADAAGATVQ